LLSRLRRRTIDLTEPAGPVGGPDPPESRTQPATTHPR
jgi:hypothetical protein